MMKTGTLVELSAAGKTRKEKYEEINGRFPTTKVGMIIKALGPDFRPWFYVRWYPTMTETGHPRYELKYAKQS